MNNTTIADFLTSRIAQLGKSQREIAQEVGYDRPNIISMFKKGITKVPLEKIPQLAAALEVDPALLFRIAMRQYWPDLQETINQVFGTVVTANEKAVLEVIRAASTNADPR